LLLLIIRACCFCGPPPLLLLLQGMATLKGNFDTKSIELVVNTLQVRGF
jgi:hypothetical protein